MPELPVNQILCGDCLEVMRDWPDKSVDLVFGSPPYEDARTYGIDFKLKSQEWVDWMFSVVIESLRICRALVAFIIEGRTENFCWSATPALLMADLHRAGIALRKPPAFHRVGIPGSGGPDWLRNDYEFIVCATNGRKLPWSDNTACGHAPKWTLGGEMSYRLLTKRRLERGNPKGSPYKSPVLANPGNVIHCHVGGGAMGNSLAHENEAPFPEDLAKFFILTFCAPGHIVVDPFVGSGTTCAAAEKSGRRWIGIDIRANQCEIARQRLKAVDTGIPVAEQQAGQLALFDEKIK